MAHLLAAGAPHRTSLFSCSCRGKRYSIARDVAEASLDSLVMPAAKRVVSGSGDAVRIGMAAWPRTLTPGGLTYQPGRSRNSWLSRGSVPAASLTHQTHGWKTLCGPSWGFTGLRGVSWDSDIDDYVDRREADHLDHLDGGKGRTLPGASPGCEDLAATAVMLALR